jgi:hypothetical protein
MSKKEDYVSGFMWLRIGSSCSCLEHSNEIMVTYSAGGICSCYIQCRWYLQLLHTAQVVSAVVTYSTGGICSCYIQHRCICSC